MKARISMLAAASLLLAAPVWAQTHGSQSNHASSEAGIGTAVEGEVRRIDKDAQKITIRHGPLAQLDMPAMTMVFQVKDPAVLDQLKPGDKIRFVPEKVGGAFLADKIEPAR